MTVKLCAAHAEQYIKAL